MLGHEIEGENQLLELPTGTHLQSNIFALCHMAVTHLLSLDCVMQLSIIVQGLFFVQFTEPRRKNEDTEEAQKRRKQRAKKRKQQMQKKIEENKVTCCP